MKKVILFMVLAISMLYMSGCADHTSVQSLCEGCHVYGFWGGFWHGIIAPFDFIGSLIWDDVTLFAQSNNGHWYDFGFLTGIGALGSSSRATVKKSRK